MNSVRFAKRERHRAKYRRRSEWKYLRAVPHPKDLRVRLLRGGGVHTGAHATLHRVALQCGRLGLNDLGSPALTDQLLNSRHVFSVTMWTYLSSSPWELTGILCCHKMLSVTEARSPSRHTGSCSQRV